MIEAHNLTRRFGTFTAVSQISLHVPPGSLLALLGPNGAGKTTTVRMLAGLIAPTEGEAQVAGYDVRLKPNMVRANVGLVTDAPGLFEQMKPVAYLDFFGSIYGMPTDERRKRIDELLEFFDLSSARNEKMAGFSKGMKQKVALARALIHQPTVLFLDEPTSGLDPLAARNVREMIVNLKHTSRSLILCTHDLDEAERLADEVAVMRQGHIVACDTPSRLRERASGETRVHIEFAHPITLSLLQTLPDLNGARFVGTTTATGQHTAEAETLALEYTTIQPTIVNPRVLTQLVNVGAQVVSLTNEYSTLEDVYASLMENKKAQESTDNVEQALV